MSSFSFALLVCGLAAAAATTPYKACGGSSTIQSLEVVGCSALPCTLQRGAKVVLNVEAAAGSATQALDSEISGVINGLPVPFSKDDKACDSITSGACPLAEGDAFSFSTSVNVLKEYPPIAVTIKWELKDDSGEVMACAEVPSHIR